MKRLLQILFVVVLVGTGCGKNQQHVSVAQRETLRALLDVTFDPTSIPKDRVEDFYQIMEAFAAGRERDEFVRSIVFRSASEADLSLSGPPNLHGGGGDATARKVKRAMEDYPEGLGSVNARTSTKKAEQVARANGHSGHASCYRYVFPNETVESSTV